MCYSGQCRYENYDGSCGSKSASMPEDAGCAIADKEIEKIEKEKRERFAREYFRNKEV